jgi:hypothetical protein
MNVIRNSPQSIGANIQRIAEEVRANKNAYWHRFTTWRAPGPS